MSANHFDLYQRLASKTADHGLKGHEEISYLLLGLVGEAGELSNKYKKFMRGDHRERGQTDEQAWQEVGLAMFHEAGDVLWYLSQLMQALGFNFSQLAEANLRKLEARRAMKTIKGSGDNR